MALYTYSQGHAWPQTLQCIAFPRHHSQALQRREALEHALRQPTELILLEVSVHTSDKNTKSILGHVLRPKGRSQVRDP